MHKAGYIGCTKYVYRHCHILFTPARWFVSKIMHHFHDHQACCYLLLSDLKLVPNELYDLINSRSNSRGVKWRGMGLLGHVARKGRREMCGGFGLET
jgi:hypothetical protein